MVSNLVRSAAAVLAATLAILLSGCISIPYTSTPQELPGVVPHLPESVRSSSDEVLVLGQFSSSKHRRPTDVVITPVFLKGQELSSLNQTLKLRTDFKALDLVLPFFFIPLGTYETGNEHLTRLCVLAPDGQSTTLSPFGNDWSATHGILYANRRDAIVAALREGGKKPFEKVDGPCDVFGDIEWPQEARSRVIAFLGRIPPHEIGDANTPISRILNETGASSNAVPPEERQVMLLATTRLRNQTIVEAPLFLATTSTMDHEKLIGILKDSKDYEILASLPSSASHASAVRLLDLCVVNKDGRVHGWSRAADTWKGPFDYAADRAWKENRLFWLAHGEHKGCGVSSVTTHTSWSEEERSKVTAFIESIQTKERP